MFRNILSVDFERQENRFRRNMGSCDLCNISVAWRDNGILFIILSKSFILMGKFTFIDLFAGIGGFHIALSNLGGKCVFASEKDEKAYRVYRRNFPDTFINRDITRFNYNNIPNHNILCGGFPCQPFSTNGKQLGFEDARGTLIFNVNEILKTKQPKAFLLENVANLVRINKGIYFERILEMLKDSGYNVFYAVINSFNYVPQMRNRVYIVGFLDHSIDFQFPQRNEKHYIYEILDDDISDAIINPKAFLIRHPDFPYSLERKKGWHAGFGCNIKTENDIAYCLCKSKPMNVFYINNIARYPSVTELKRLQGFPENYKISGAYSTISSLFGNSVTVPVIQDIATNIVNHLFPCSH